MGRGEGDEEGDEGGRAGGGGDVITDHTSLHPLHPITPLLPFPLPPFPHPPPIPPFPPSPPFPSTKSIIKSFIICLLSVGFFLFIALFLKTSVRDGDLCV